MKPTAQTNKTEMKNKNTKKILQWRKTNIKREKKTEDTKKNVGQKLTYIIANCIIDIRWYFDNLWAIRAWVVCKAPRIPETRWRITLRCHFFLLLLRSNGLPMFDAVLKIDSSVFCSLFHLIFTILIVVKIFLRCMFIEYSFFPMFEPVVISWNTQTRSRDNHTQKCSFLFNPATVRTTSTAKKKWKEKEMNI